MNRMLLMFTLCAAVFAGCSKKSSGDAAKPTPPAEPATATAPAPVEAEPPAPAPPAPPRAASTTLAPTAKSKVTGTVSFKEVEGGVEVTANVENLKPGDHGFHVHEKGDCSAPDASSAGGHFNPGGHPHGAPDAEHRHEGDFGNLTAGKDGKATKTFVMKGITLDDSPTSIIGKGFIVHEKADDFKTQPTGNAGGRVACGVIALVP